MKSEQKALNSALNMGSSCFKEAKPGRQINKNIAEEQKRKPYNILLLGSGESGKSTILRQLELLHGEGFSKEMRFLKKPHALANVVEGAYIAIEAGQHSQYRLEDEKAKAAAKTIQRFFLENAQSVVKAMDNIKNFLPDGIPAIPANVAEAVNILAKDPNFIKTLSLPNLQVQDGWEYFMDQMKNYPAWGGPNWTPNDIDILHIRARTAGVNKARLSFENQKEKPFIVHDVGGQKGERTKWIRLMQNVDVLMYVQSLGEYDQKMFEDEEVYRLRDSSQLWENTISNVAFKDSAAVLLLNKRDVLEKKFCQLKIPFDTSLETESFRVPRYDGELSNEENVDIVTTWFKQRFMELAPPDKDIITHVVTAIDTEIMKTITDAILFHIFDQQLINVGFVKDDKRSSLV